MSHETHILQRQFIAYMRDEHAAPLENVSIKRQNIYRELVYNNIEDIISGTFPILRSLYSENVWRILIECFIREHQSQSPLFCELGAEFVSFLQTQQLSFNVNEQITEHLTLQKNELFKPFTVELAHYEWLEIAMNMENSVIDWQHINKNGDLLAGVPIVSPHACLAAYQFPVHMIGQNFQPITPPANATYIIIYRNLAHEVKFTEINIIAARLAELLMQENNILTGEQILLQIAQELQHPDPKIIIENGYDILTQWHANNIILGTSCKNISN